MPRLMDTIAEVLDPSDGAQQHRGTDWADALDAHQIFVAGQLGPLFFDQFLQFGNALVKTADLMHQHTDLGG